MNGLVWKDFVVMRSGLAYIALLAVVFCAVFHDNTTMCMVATMMFASLSSSSFSYDEMCQWNLFAVSSGVDRRSVIRSKFVTSALVVALGAAVGTAMVLGAGIATGSGIDVPGCLMLGVTGLFAGFLVMAIMVAVNVLTNNSLMAQYMSIVVLMASIALIIASTLIATDIVGDDAWAVTAVLAVITAAACALSYRVATARFLRRDLRRQPI